MEPFVVVQLSDLHIGAVWEEGDPAGTLQATIDRVARLSVRPDAVLLTGDLADNAAEGEYAVVRELVGQLHAPVHALPGNHDDPELVRRAFALPGEPGSPLQYSVDLGPLRLVLLDSTRRGADAGELDGAQLDWLDGELASSPGRPTLVALHHPPFALGIEVWDRIGLPASERAALDEIVRRHPQVRRLVAGHVHQVIVDDVGGRPALTVPSTFRQARFDLRADAIELTDEPPGFAVHVLRDGALVSFVEEVG